MGGKPTVTEAQALVVVQKVLSGELNRDGLAKLVTRELAYMTVALMFSLPSDYVEKVGTDWHARLPLTRAAERLVVLGVPYNRDHHVSGARIAWDCTDAGLSKRTDIRRGHTRVMQLTPPEALYALAVSARESPAIQRFEEAVQAEADQRQAAIAARRQRRGVKP